MLSVERLGLVEYEAGTALQQDRLARRIAGEIEDTLLLLEHPPIFTLGRGTHPENVRAPGAIPVVETERGGDVTLHAPGQLVGYLIRLLPGGARDLHAHLRLVEETLIEVLLAFHLKGSRIPGKTGVWIDDRKIASIGIACRRWCTWHGFALNVRNDLALFERINPCGFEAGVMTSLSRELGQDVPLSAVEEEVARAARSIFDRSATR